MINLHLNSSNSIMEELAKYQNNEIIHVYLANGVYYQKLRIYNDNITFTGESKTDTIISFDDYATKIHSDGKEYNTFRTPTMTILGNNVVLENMTIRNTAGYGKEISQAVALSLYGDLITLRDCNLEGYQDTLFCGPLPEDLTIRYQGFLPDEELNTKLTHQRFLHCTIKGSVDFIFGSASALFEDCDIYALLPGYIAAPSTYENAEIGLVFYKSKIISITSEVYLARPWREHGCSIFCDCIFEGEFAKERYHDWNKHKYRFYETPYVETPMSQDLPKERMKLLKNDFDHLFTK